MLDAGCGTARARCTVPVWGLGWDWRFGVWDRIVGMGGGCGRCVRRCRHEPKFGEVRAVLVLARARRSLAKSPLWGIEKRFFGAGFLGNAVGLGLARVARFGVWFLRGMG